MPANESEPAEIRRVRTRLERCARDIESHTTPLESLYAERNRLYEDGEALRVTQVQLAAWARSTPGAVAKALRKLKESDRGS